MKLPSILNKRPDPEVTARKRIVSEFVYDPKAKAKTNLAKIKEMAKTIGKKQKRNIPRVIILNHENDSIEVQYLNSAEAKGFDHEIVAKELFGADGSYTYIVLKDVPDQQKFLELREHGEYANVKELPHQVRPAVAERQRIPQEQQIPSQIKRVPLDSNFAKRVAEGWEQDKQAAKRPEVRQQ